ncbi:MAG: cytochrome P450 [Novosphingobium sp.]
MFRMNWSGKRTSRPSRLPRRIRFAGWASWDFTFHGVQLRAGDAVTAYLSLASRDPHAFENPHVVDIDRKPRHLAFGTGPHTCLGLRLARLEIRIVLEIFLARFRNIRMAEGEQHKFHVGSVFGIDCLPLAWEPVGRDCSDG